MLPADLAAFAVLAAMLVFPGVLVLRARWTAVPFLSTAFWIVSCVWLPEPSGGRAKLVFFVAAFAAFLIAMRLGKGLAPQEAASRPDRGFERPRVSGIALLVVSAALLRLAPFAWWDVAPGAEMSLHSLETRLYVWRDGLPHTYEPVLPIHTFGAHPPGLHVLAGDVALLSGASPARAALLVSLAAHGLVVLALFALLRTAFEPRVAAVSSVLAAAAAPFPQWLVAGGSNASVLALALAIAAAALLRAHRSDASATAAGMLAAAAALCDPPMGLVTLLAGGGRRRWAITLGTALVLAIPFLAWRGSWHLVPLGLAGLLVPFAGAGLADGLTRLRGRGAAVFLPAMVAAALIVSLRTYFLAKPPGVPDAADLAALRWIEDNTRMTDVVCAGTGAAGVWIPALTGRGTDEAHVPARYRDELHRGMASRPCAYTYTREGQTVRIFGADGRVAYDRQP